MSLVISILPREEWKSFWGKDVRCLCTVNRNIKVIHRKYEFMIFHYLRQWHRDDVPVFSWQVNIATFVRGMNTSNIYVDSNRCSVLIRIGTIFRDETHWRDGNGFIRFRASAAFYHTVNFATILCFCKLEFNGAQHRRSLTKKRVITGHYRQCRCSHDRIVQITKIVTGERVVV